MKNTEAVIILGAGGHARVIVETLRLLNIKILGLIDEMEHSDKNRFGLPILGNESFLESVDKTITYLINGIGNISIRKMLYEKFTNKGFKFFSLIHPSAIVANDVILGEGVQVFPRVVINPGTRIGDNVIINTGSIVEHDCQVDAHVHISPGAILCGGVKIAEGVHMGAGSVAIQSICVGKDSLIGAGAVIINNIPENVRVKGVPAKEFN